MTWTDYPTCPHCGQVDQDWWDASGVPLNANDGDEWNSNCGSCGRDYKVTMSVSPEFSTSALGERAMIDIKTRPTDLVTRLRSCHVEYVDGLAVGYSGPVNPDGPEAADEIERLRTASNTANLRLSAARCDTLTLNEEIARLRAALELIAESSDAGRHDGLPESCPAYSDPWRPWIIAQGALEDWRPFHTAPKDGLPIQAYIPGHGWDNIIAWVGGSEGTEIEAGTVGAWSFVEDQEPPQCWTDGVCWESNEDGVKSVQPTHWRPLEQ